MSPLAAYCNEGVAKEACKEGFRQLDGWMGDETMQGVACGNLALLEARGCGNMVYSGECNKQRKARSLSPSSLRSDFASLCPLPVSQAVSDIVIAAPLRIIVYVGNASKGHRLAHNNTSEHIHKLQGRP